MTDAAPETTPEALPEEKLKDREGNPIKCDICGRKRTDGTVKKYPNDGFDYSSIRVMTDDRWGWYNASDGQICPEDFRDMYERSNKVGKYAEQPEEQEPAPAE